MAYAGAVVTALQAPVSPGRVVRRSRRGQGHGAIKSAYLRRQARWCPVPALATAAPEKSMRRDEAASPQAPPPFKDSSAAPVLVAVIVPNCRLSPGEELRLMGDCRELGSWDPAAAVPLTRSSDGRTWEVAVPLAPGQHECKLLIARINRGDVVCWEGGPNRQLRVPHLSGLEVPPGVPLWQGVCRFGDTSRTQLKVSPLVDPRQLKEAAAAAVQRCAELAEKRETLEARLGHLAHEVETSEVRIASKRTELQQMVADELAQLGQRGLVSDQVARLEGGTASAQAATGAHPAAPAAPPSVALQQRQRQPEPEAKLAPPAAAAGASPAAEPPKQAADDAAHVSATRDGCSEFHFEGQQSREAGPSAFQLAKQRLLQLLPAEAEAELEARLQREQRAAAAAAAAALAEPTPVPVEASAVPKPATPPAPRPAAAVQPAAQPASAPTVPAKPQAAPGPATVPAVALVAAAKAGAAKAAAQASALQAAASHAKASAPSAALKPAAPLPADSPASSTPAASPLPAVHASKLQQAAQQKQEAAKAPAAPRRAQADVASLMDKPSMPVVAALAVGQQMFRAYRTLWGCAMAAALPTPAAQRTIDAAAAITLGVVASIPFWG
ncbi:hypothetical protein ABPG75_011686 [Micractinium tetrahymenae]